jgi:HTH-type transcriptional regulator/antitoxin HigA
MAHTKDDATRYKYAPDYAVAPGQTLQETIDALGMDQRELALRTGLSPKHINQIIKGVATISQDTAIRLERVTGVPARMWNKLEANYREQLARLAERDRLQRDVQWLQNIPTKELIRRGGIKDVADPVQLLDEVLRFFGVANVEAWHEGWAIPQFAFRRSLAFQGKAGAMAAWLRLCELEARERRCRPFDKAAFRSAVAAIRSLTTKRPQMFVPEMIDLCASAGVALALVPELKDAPVTGAAKWVTPDKAIIGLNLRGKSNDHFWFTFFHEAGHILNDSKKETYIDAAYKDDPREKKANQFAANILIPPENIEALSRLKSYRAVLAFARSIGIAPAIVVGRLQREGIVPYSHLNRLKVRLEWVAE